SSPHGSSRRSASLALVLQSFPRAQLPVAVAIWSAVGAFAGAVGPTLGALVIEHVGWRWAFYINVPVGILSRALGRRVLTEGREANPGRFPDVASIVLLIGSIAALAFGIVQTLVWPIAVAAVLLVGVLVRSRRVTNPLIDLGLFRSPAFSLANTALFLFAIGFAAMFLGNVLFLTQVWGYSIMRAGLVMSVGPFVVATTAPLFGRLAGRIGQRALAIPGGLVWASGGLLLLATATSEPHYVSQFLPAVLLTGLGVSLVLPQLSSVSVQDLPPDRFGAGSAVSQALRNLGATIGVALVVAFTAAMTPATALAHFREVWWLLAASGGCVTALAVLLPRRGRRVPARAIG
ncbi:MAG: MFS transporter, partial [Deltaproteobacteria bacterium]|nr:MFS transporter [Deltaproteobacteria bacterium]